ncbi:MAG: PhoH family protein [Chlamydiales bacterium]|nr:PhoH family protein [Chlamydiales bacterium]
MKKKTYVLDTNILLHDPNAITRFVGNEVGVPLAVIEELDQMKHFNDELGKNARYAIRFIDQMAEFGDLQQGIDIGSNTTLRVILESKNGEKKTFPLPLDRVKNKILLAAHTLKENGDNVILVSKDVVMRVKAQTMGLPAEDYESSKESFSNLYSGIRKIQVAKSEVDQFYAAGYLVLPSETFFPNEYCILTSLENSSAICKYNGRSKRLEPLINLSRDIWGIHPLNVEQRCAIDLLLRDDIKLVTLVGKAGSGKTLMTVACALRKVFDEAHYSRILISRPIMPLGKDIGYLPGTKEEKLYHWMQPIYDNLQLLCESNGGEEVGKETQKWILDSKKIEMEAVTYIRGRSLSKMFIIIDEAQNLTPHEIKTIISRAGHGTKIVLTGDPTQIDNPYLDTDSNALTYIVNKFKHFPIFGHILLSKTERSELAALATEVL